MQPYCNKLGHYLLKNNSDVGFTFASDKNHVKDEK